MSEVNPSGSQDQASGDDQGTKQTVSHETYAKVLSEKKAFQAKLKEQEEILSKIAQEKLEAEGKFKESAEHNKKLAEQYKTQNLELVKNITNKTIKSQFKSAAEKLGCVDAEIAMKACSFDDLEVTEDFEFDNQKLVGKIQELTKSKPYLFKKDFKMVQDITPSNSSIPTKSLTDLSEQELKNLLKNAK